MFEAITAEVLNRLLGSYIKPGSFSSDRVSTSVYGGQLKLEGLEIREDAFDLFHLPIVIKKGFVGSADIRIPWTQLGSHPVEIRLTDVMLIIVPKYEWTDEELLKRSVILKKSQLERAELMKKTEEALLGISGTSVIGSSSDASNALSSGKGVNQSSQSQQKFGFFGRLLENISDNIELQLHNIHIRYEHESNGRFVNIDSSNQGKGEVFSFGICLDSLHMRSTDRNWVPTFVDIAALQQKLVAKQQKIQQQLLEIQRERQKSHRKRRDDSNSNINSNNNNGNNNNNLGMGDLNKNDGDNESNSKQKGEPSFSTHQSRKKIPKQPRFLTYKLIRFENLSIYLDPVVDIRTHSSDGEPFSYDSGKHQEFCTFMRGFIKKTAPTKGAPVDYPFHYLLKPFNADMRIKLSRNLLDLTTPNQIFEFLVGNISLDFYGFQYRYVQQYLQTYEAYTKAQKYAKLRPALPPISSAPHRWWLFAINAVSRDIRQRKYQWSKEFICKRRRTRLEYMSLWTRRLVGDEKLPTLSSDSDPYQTNVSGNRNDGKDDSNSKEGQDGNREENANDLGSTTTASSASNLIANKTIRYYTPLTETEKIRLDALEKELPLEDLILFRSLAENKLRLEQAQLEILKRKTQLLQTGPNANNSSNAASSSDGNTSTLSRFGQAALSWLNWPKSVIYSSSADGSGSHNSGYDSSKGKSVLLTLEEQARLINLLRYDPLKAAFSNVDGSNNEMINPDRVTLTLQFRLDRGSICLYSASYAYPVQQQSINRATAEALLRISFERLCSNIAVRLNETYSGSLSLDMFEVYDSREPNSKFNRILYSKASQSHGGRQNIRKMPSATDYGKGRVPVSSSPAGYEKSQPKKRQSSLEREARGLRSKYQGNEDIFGTDGYQVSPKMGNKSISERRSNFQSKRENRSLSTMAMESVGLLDALPINDMLDTLREERSDSGSSEPSDGFVDFDSEEDGDYEITVDAFGEHEQLREKSKKTDFSDRFTKRVGNPIFWVRIETRSQQSTKNVDSFSSSSLKRFRTKLEVKLLPLEIVIKIDCFLHVMQAFALPSNLVTTDSVSDDDAQFDSQMIKERIDYALEAHPQFSIDVDVFAPVIILPREEKSQETILLVVDLGRLTIKDNPANHMYNPYDAASITTSQSASETIKSNINPQGSNISQMYPKASMTSPEGNGNDYYDSNSSNMHQSISRYSDRHMIDASHMFEQYNLILSRVQVLLVEDANESWRRVKEQYRLRMHLVDQFSIQMNFCLSIVPFEIFLPQLKVLANLPSIHIRLSPEKMIGMMKIVAAVTDKINDFEQMMKKKQESEITKSSLKTPDLVRQKSTLLKRQKSAQLLSPPPPPPVSAQRAAQEYFILSSGMDQAKKKGDQDISEEHTLPDPPILDVIRTKSVDDKDANLRQRGKTVDMKSPTKSSPYFGSSAQSIISRASSTNRSLANKAGTSHFIKVGSLSNLELTEPADATKDGPKSLEASLSATLSSTAHKINDTQSDNDEQDDYFSAIDDTKSVGLFPSHTRSVSSRVQIEPLGPNQLRFSAIPQDQASSKDKDDDEDAVSMYTTNMWERDDMSLSSRNLSNQLNRAGSDVKRAFQRQNSAGNQKNMNQSSKGKKGMNPFSQKFLNKVHMLVRFSIDSIRISISASGMKKTASAYKFDQMKMNRNRSHTESAILQAGSKSAQNVSQRNQNKPKAMLKPRISQNVAEWLDEISHMEVKENQKTMKATDSTNQKEPGHSRSRSTPHILGVKQLSEKNDNADTKIVSYDSGNNSKDSPIAKGKQSRAQSEDINTNEEKESRDDVDDDDNYNDDLWIEESPAIENGVVCLEILKIQSDIVFRRFDSRLDFRLGSLRVEDLMQPPDAPIHRRYLIHSDFGDNNLVPLIGPLSYPQMYHDQLQQQANSWNRKQSQSYSMNKMQTGSISNFLGVTGNLSTTKYPNHSPVRLDLQESIDFPQISKFLSENRYLSKYSSSVQKDQGMGMYSGGSLDGIENEINIQGQKNLQANNQFSFRTTGYMPAKETGQQSKSLIDDDITLESDLVRLRIAQISKDSVDYNEISTFVILNTDSLDVIVRQSAIIAILDAFLQEPIMSFQSSSAGTKDINNHDATIGQDGNNNNNSNNPSAVAKKKDNATGTASFYVSASWNGIRVWLASSIMPSYNNSGLFVASSNAGSRDNLISPTAKTGMKSLISKDKKSSFLEDKSIWNPEAFCMMTLDVVELQLLSQPNSKLVLDGSLGGISVVQLLSSRLMPKKQGNDKSKATNPFEVLSSSFAKGLNGIKMFSVQKSSTQKSMIRFSACKHGNTFGDADSPFIYTCSKASVSSLKQLSLDAQRSPKSASKFDISAIDSTFVDPNHSFAHFDQELDEILDQFLKDSPTQSPIAKGKREEKSSTSDESMQKDWVSYSPSKMIPSIVESVPAPALPVKFEISVEFQSVHMLLDMEFFSELFRYFEEGEVYGYMRAKKLNQRGQEKKQQKAQSDIDKNKKGDENDITDDEKLSDRDSPKFDETNLNESSISKADTLLLEAKDHPAENISYTIFMVSMGNPLFELPSRPLNIYDADCNIFLLHKNYGSTASLSQMAALNSDQNMLFHDASALTSSQLSTRYFDSVVIDLGNIHFMNRFFLTDANDLSLPVHDNAYYSFDNEEDQKKVSRTESSTGTVEPKAMHTLERIEVDVQAFRLLFHKGLNIDLSSPNALKSRDKLPSASSSSSSLIGGHHVESVVLNIVDETNLHLRIARPVGTTFLHTFNAYQPIPTATSDGTTIQSPKKSSGDMVIWWAWRILPYIYTGDRIYSNSSSFKMFRASMEISNIVFNISEPLVSLFQKVYKNITDNLPKQASESSNHQHKHDANGAFNSVEDHDAENNSSSGMNFGFSCSLSSVSIQLLHDAGYFKLNGNDQIKQMKISTKTVYTNYRTPSSHQLMIPIASLLLSNLDISCSKSSSGLSAKFMIKDMFFEDKQNGAGIPLGTGASSNQNRSIFTYLFLSQVEHLRMDQPIISVEFLHHNNGMHSENQEQAVLTASIAHPRIVINNDILDQLQSYADRAISLVEEEKNKSEAENAENSNDSEMHYESEYDTTTDGKPSDSTKAKSDTLNVSGEQQEEDEEEDEEEQDGESFNEPETKNESEEIGEQSRENSINLFDDGNEDGDVIDIASDANNAGDSVRSIQELLPSSLSQWAIQLKVENIEICFPEVLTSKATKILSIRASAFAEASIFGDIDAVPPPGSRLKPQLSRTDAISTKHLDLSTDTTKAFLEEIENKTNLPQFDFKLRGCTVGVRSASEYDYSLPQSMQQTNSGATTTGIQGASYQQGSFPIRSSKPPKQQVTQMILPFDGKLQVQFPQFENDDTPKGNGWDGVDEYHSSINNNNDEDGAYDFRREATLQVGLIESKITFNEIILIQKILDRFQAKSAVSNAAAKSKGKSQAQFSSSQTLSGSLSSDDLDISANKSLTFVSASNEVIDPNLNLAASSTLENERIRRSMGIGNDPTPSGASNLILSAKLNPDGNNKPKKRRSNLKNFVVDIHLGGAFMLLCNDQEAPIIRLHVTKASGSHRVEEDLRVSHLSCKFLSDYFNYRFGGWEPLVEPWEFDIHATVPRASKQAMPITAESAVRNLNRSFASSPLYNVGNIANNSSSVRTSINGLERSQSNVEDNSVVPAETTSTLQVSLTSSVMLDVNISESLIETLTNAMNSWKVFSNAYGKEKLSQLFPRSSDSPASGTILENLGQSNKSSISLSRNDQMSPSPTFSGLASSLKGNVDTASEKNTLLSTFRIRNDTGLRLIYKVSIDGESNERLSMNRFRLEPGAEESIQYNFQSSAASSLDSLRVSLLFHPIESLQNENEAYINVSPWFPISDVYLNREGANVYGLKEKNSSFSSSSTFENMEGKSSTDNEDVISTEEPGNMRIDVNTPVVVCEMISVTGSKLLLIRSPLLLRNESQSPIKLSVMSPDYHKDHESSSSQADERAIQNQDEIIWSDVVEAGQMIPIPVTIAHRVFYGESMVPSSSANNICNLSLRVKLLTSEEGKYQDSELLLPGIEDVQNNRSASLRKVIYFEPLQQNIPSQMLLSEFNTGASAVSVLSTQMEKISTQKNIQTIYGSLAMLLSHSKIMHTTRLHIFSFASPVVIHNLLPKEISCNMTPCFVPAWIRSRNIDDGEQIAIHETEKHQSKKQHDCKIKPGTSTHWYGLNSETMFSFSMSMQGFNASYLIMIQGVQSISTKRLRNYQTGQDANSEQQRLSSQSWATETSNNGGGLSDTIYRSARAIKKWWLKHLGLRSQSNTNENLSTRMPQLMDSRNRDTRLYNLEPAKASVVLRNCKIKDQSSRELTVYLEVETLTNGTRSISIYVPFWIMNKSKIPLLVRSLTTASFEQFSQRFRNSLQDSNQSGKISLGDDRIAPGQVRALKLMHRMQTQKRIRDQRHDYTLPVTGLVDIIDEFESSQVQGSGNDEGYDEDILMFSDHEGGIELKAPDTVWSSAISLDSVGLDCQVDIRQESNLSSSSSSSDTLLPQNLRPGSTTKSHNDDDYYSSYGDDGRPRMRHRGNNQQNNVYANQHQRLSANQVRKRQELMEQRLKIYSFSVSTGFAQPPFDRTVIVTITPRIILMNCLDRPIRVAQISSLRGKSTHAMLSRGIAYSFSQLQAKRHFGGSSLGDNISNYHNQPDLSHSMQCIAPKSHIPWNWFASELKQELSVCFDEFGWEWSCGFGINNSGETIVRMRNSHTRTFYMLRVDVSIVHGMDDMSSTLLVRFREESTTMPPYRIENLSLHTLKIRQVGTSKEFEQTILPYHSCVYSWDDLSSPHRIVVETLAPIIGANIASRTESFDNQEQSYLSSLTRFMMPQRWFGWISLRPLNRPLTYMTKKINDLCFQILSHIVSQSVITWFSPPKTYTGGESIVGSSFSLGEFSLDQVQAEGIPTTVDYIFGHINGDGPTRVLSIVDARIDKGNRAQQASLYNRLAQARQNAQKISFVINLKGVGVSVVESYPCREISYISATGIRLSDVTFGYEQKLTVEISRLQVDNQLLFAQTPVVITHEDNSIISSNFPTSIASRSEKMIEILIIRSKQNPDMDLIQKLDIYIAPLIINLEMEFLANIYLFSKRISKSSQIIQGKYPSGLNPNVSNARAIKNDEPPSSLSSSSKPQRDGQNIITLQDSSKNDLAQSAPESQSNKSYIEQLCIRPIQLLVSFRGAGFFLGNVGRLPNSKSGASGSESAFGKLASFIDDGILLVSKSIRHGFRAVLSTIASIENAPLYFDGITVDHSSMSGIVLNERLVSHYRVQALSQLYVLLGSAGILGNPISFYSNVRKGVFGLTHEISIGLKEHSVLKTMYGVIRGTARFVQYTVFASTKAISTICRSTSNLLETLLIHPYRYDFLSSMQRNPMVANNSDILGTVSIASRVQQPIFLTLSSWQKSASFSKMTPFALATSFLSRFVDSLLAPYFGLRLHGPFGLFRGLFICVAGIYLNPILVILFVVEKLASSVSFLIDPSNRSSVKRFRPPRTFARQGPPILTLYDYERASGEDILRHINDGRFSSERYLGHEVIGSHLLVATTNHLLFAMDDVVYNQAIWVLSRSSFISFYLYASGKNGVEYLDFDMFDEHNVENVHTNEDLEDFIETQTGCNSIISIRILLLSPLRSSKHPISSYVHQQSRGLSFPYIEIRLASKDGKKKENVNIIQLIQLLRQWERSSSTAPISAPITASMATSPIPPTNAMSPLLARIV